jgi:hypothetical protein
VLSVCPVKTTQNASLALLVSKPPQFRQFPWSDRNAPGFYRGNTGGCMVCYQVLAQYAFIHHKAVLVSTHVKKQKVKAFLVRSGLPFGHGLKHRRFFRTEKEAACYAAHLHAVYKNRIVSNPPLPGGQLTLF